MNKSLKALLTTFLSLGLLMGGVGTILAEGQAEPVFLVFQGRHLETTALLVDGVSYVPLHDIGDELGFSIAESYIDDSLIISRANKKIEVLNGKARALVNGHEVLVPARLEILKGKMMVPLRFVLENLGYSVVWIDRPYREDAEVPGFLFPRVDISLKEENDIAIATLRERLETSTLSVDIQFPKILGLSDEILKPTNAYLAEHYEDFRIEALKNEKALTEAGLKRPTELVVDYAVAYNENGILSLLLDKYLYEGGAHGRTKRSGYTVYLETGKTYELKDLFKPGADYVSVINAEIAEQIKERDLSLLAPFLSVRPDQDFYIKDGQIIVFFQQYELMAYAYGFPEFRIPRAVLGDILVDELLALE